MVKLLFTTQKNCTTYLMFLIGQEPLEYCAVKILCDIVNLVVAIMASTATIIIAQSHSNILCNLHTLCGNCSLIRANACTCDTNALRLYANNINKKKMRREMKQMALYPIIYAIHILFMNSYEAFEFGENCFSFFLSFV